MFRYEKCIFGAKNALSKRRSRAAGRADLEEEPAREVVAVVVLLLLGRARRLVGLLRRLGHLQLLQRRVETSRANAS